MNRYLTLGPRLLALIIDAIVFAPVVLLFMLVDDMGMPEWGIYVIVPILSVAGVAYNVILHWRFGQTLGKMVMRVKVLNLAEEPITFGQACLRDVAYIIFKALEIGSTLYLIIAGSQLVAETVVSGQQYLSIPIIAWFVIDAIVCMKNDKNRALHDIIAGTVVVRVDVPAENEAGRNLGPPRPEAYAGLGANAD